jgi:thiol-disulfide isomerase/thioredoxin
MLKKISWTILIYFFCHSFIWATTRSPPLDTIKKFNNKGNLILLQNPNMAGEGMENRIKHFEYDRKKRIKKEYLSDTLGNILKRRNLSSITTYEYKKKKGKKIVITSFYDHQMKLSHFSEAGFHRCMTSYDKNDKKTEDWCFNKEGYTQSRTQYIYNKKRLLSDVLYLDDAGAFIQEGYSIVQLEYDEKDREVKRSYFDFNHEPYAGMGEAFVVETDWSKDANCKRFYNLKMELMSNSILRNPYPSLEISMAGAEKGVVHSLASLKGKVVILDFWASWCRPCRKHNPILVKLYDEYKDKGLEIFSVSLDDVDERWKKAIEDDNLYWRYHVSDLQKWNNKAAEEYRVNAIPLLYIIDREGNIVAKNPRGFCKIEEILLEFL